MSSPPFAYHTQPHPPSHTRLRVRWHSPRLGELDHERLWLIVTVAASAVAGVGWQIGVRPPPCFFHLLTGIPCPGCGSTRAVLQLAHGHVAAAFNFNPLTTLAALSLGMYCVYAALVLASGCSRLRFTFRSRLWSGVLRGTALTAIAVNWWWVIAHRL